jgi:hypothetical protein
MRHQVRFGAAALALFLAAATGRADVILQEIVDGTVSSQPKWVELANTGTDCVFLGDYELCNYNNGATTPSGCSDLADVFLAPGASYVFAYESASNTACSPIMTCFEVVYGFAPDQNGGASINGDDAVALRHDATGVVVDVYGVIGEDGTGQVWEYTDGYSARKTPTASAVFVAADWTFGGVNSLEDPGGDPVEIGLLQTLTLPGTYAPCTPAVVNYCTAGTSTGGCRASLSASGVASASAASGFTLSASDVEGARTGVFFFGSSGRQAAPWGGGTSFQCVLPPTARTGLMTGSGAQGACDATYARDLNALWCTTCPKANLNPQPGTVMQAQFWYRDPQNSASLSTSLSDALEFTVTP